MTFKTLLLAASAGLAISATGAAASPFDTAALTFGHDTFGYEDDSSADSSWVRVDLGTEVFGLNADFAMSQGSLGEEQQTTVLSFALAKEIAGTTIGAFYDVPLIDGDDQEIRHYGAKTSFDFAGFDFAGFAGRGEIEGETSRIYGASVQRDIGKGFDAGLFANNEVFDEMGLDVSERGMSVGYTSTGLPLETRFNAYVSQADIDFDVVETDVKRVGFTISVPLQQGGKAPAGRLAAHQHSALYNEFGYSEGFMAP